MAPKRARWKPPPLLPTGPKSISPPVPAPVASRISEKSAVSPEIVPAPRSIAPPSFAVPCSVSMVNGSTEVSSETITLGDPMMVNAAGDAPAPPGPCVSKKMSSFSVTLPVVPVSVVSIVTLLTYVRPDVPPLFPNSPSDTVPPAVPTLSVVVIDRFHGPLESLTVSAALLS